MINYTSADSKQKVAVIIPTHNRCESALRAIESLVQDNYRNKQIYLVNDGSSDNTREKVLQRYPQVIICQGNGNLWWSGAINLGLAYALKSDCNLVLWLNDDNCVDVNTINIMVDAHQQCGKNSVIASRTLSLQTKDVEWAGEPPRWHPDFQNWQMFDSNDEIHSLQHPPGGRGVLFPLQCFVQLGLVDAHNFPHYWADHDFHYRAMKAGYNYYLVDNAIVLNSQNVPLVSEQNRFSAIGLYKFIFSRRSPMNFVTLRRLLKRHLEPDQFQQVWPSFMKSTLIWLLTEWIRRYSTILNRVKLLKNLSI